MAYFECSGNKKEKPSLVYASSSMETTLNLSGINSGDYYVLNELTVCDKSSISVSIQNGMNILQSNLSVMYNKNYTSYYYYFLYTHIFIATSSSITYTSSSGGYKIYHVYKI